MSLYGLLKSECSKPQGSTENDAKLNFLRNSMNRYEPHIHRVHKKFDLNCIGNDSFETILKFLTKTYLNIRRAVTDGPFSTEICQGCMFNPKKEIPYWL